MKTVRFNNTPSITTYIIDSYENNITYSELYDLNNRLTDIEYSIIAEHKDKLLKLDNLTFNFNRNIEKYNNKIFFIKIMQIYYPFINDKNSITNIDNLYINNTIINIDTIYWNINTVRKLDIQLYYKNNLDDIELASIHKLDIQDIMEDYSTGIYNFNFYDKFSGVFIDFVASI
jgi:hypothetical protein